MQKTNRAIASMKIGSLQITIIQQHHTFRINHESLAANMLVCADIVKTAYTCTHYHEMILIYGEYQRNARAIAGVYSERFPRDQHPSQETITHCAVWERPTLLHAHGAHPYNPRLAQIMMLGGHTRRFDCCNFTLNRGKSIVPLWDSVHRWVNVYMQWNYECPQCGLLISEKPHVAHTVRHHASWSTNVWCGTLGSHIVRLIFYDGIVTS